MPTALNNAIEFLRDFGFFNVVLPFMLVFTIVFGILEKTKLFGTEGTGDKARPKKNLDAMVAFSVAFFVVAASNIVEVIQTSLPAVTLVLVILLFTMLLLGSFAAETDKGLDFWTAHKYTPLRVLVITAVLVSIIGIFLNSFGYLGLVWNYIITQVNDTMFASVVFLVLIIAAVWYIMKSDDHSPEKKPGES